MKITVVAMFLGLVSSCGGEIDTSGGSTNTSGSACGPVQPCTDEAGEASLDHQCDAQYPGSTNARACGLQEQTPPACADLIVPAPLMCVDGSSRRVICCPVSP